MRCTRTDAKQRASCERTYIMYDNNIVEVLTRSCNCENEYDKKKRKKIYKKKSSSPPPVSNSLLMRRGFSRAVVIIAAKTRNAKKKIMVRARRPGEMGRNINNNGNTVFPMVKECPGDHPRKSIPHILNPTKYRS